MVMGSSDPGLMSVFWTVVEGMGTLLKLIDASDRDPLESTSPIEVQARCPGRHLILYLSIQVVEGSTTTGLPGSRSLQELE